MSDYQNGPRDVRFFVEHVSRSADRDEAENLFLKLWNREGTPAEADQWLARLQEIAPRYFRRHPGWYLVTRVEARRPYEKLRRELGEHLSKDHLCVVVSRLLQPDGTDGDYEAGLWVLFESIPGLEIRYSPLEELMARWSVADLVDQALAGQPLLLAEVDGISDG